MRLINKGVDPSYIFHCMICGAEFEAYGKEFEKEFCSSIDDEVEAICGEVSAWRYSAICPVCGDRVVEVDIINEC